MSWLTTKIESARAALKRQNAVLPNFFIAGAARSGTTSMWRYLQDHPDIFMPVEFSRKEPAFFCEYRAHFGMENREDYLNLFANSGERRMRGEASTAYLTSPESPELIKREIPDARFIIMLRNPAVRAHSLYKWMHQYGFELLPTFEEALAAEENGRRDNPQFMRNNGQYYYNFLYFNSGLYSTQLERFFRTFGRDQVHVLVFEEFKKQTLPAVQAAYRFLGVDPTFTPTLEVHNPSSDAYGKLDRALRQSLLDRYAKDIDRVGQLLSRDLKSIWV